eukprot:1582882-Prymnesium_polylepis.1
MRRRRTARSTPHPPCTTLRWTSMRTRATRHSRTCATALTRHRGKRSARPNLNCGCSAARAAQRCARPAAATHPRAPSADARRAMQDFGTDHGGRAALKTTDGWLADLPDNTHTNELRKHAKRHHGQQLRRPPLLPVHYFVVDPMHGMHNEANVLLDESVHKHLMVESKEPEVKKTIKEAQAKDQREVEGRQSAQGAHGHAMNGPTVEYVMDHPALVIDTIKDMQPVYQLLEARKKTPPLQPDA